MMMNEPVTIVVGSEARSVDAVSERLVALHGKLKRIAKARAQLDVKEAEALREAQKLQLWKQFGHTSLVDYMVQELGYTSWRTAEDRLRLANALPELPKLTEALQTGILNAGQAREIARVATPQTEENWIDKARDLNVRDVEKAVAGHCKGDLPEDPIDPRLVRKTLWLSVRPETEVLFRETRKRLDKERGEKLDEDAVLEALCRAYLNRADRADRADRGESTHVGAKIVHEHGEPAPDHNANDANAANANAANANAANANAANANTANADAANANAANANAANANADAANANAANAANASAANAASAANTNAANAKAKTTAAAAPYRIAVTICTECNRGWQHGGGVAEEMTPPAVEMAKCDAQWIGDLQSGAVERAYEEIPRAMRIKVLHRDQERCKVPSCGAHNNLDVHHIVHREHGGTNELSNLIVLCEAHHLAHHAGALVIERAANGELMFRREGRNNFTRVTREVETKKALRARGFVTAQVKEIMTRTATHVGLNDISAEQWLAIALRYAEKLGMS